MVKINFKVTAKKARTSVRFDCVEGHYIEREVDHRDPLKIDVPDNAYMFFFYDEISAVAIYGKEEIRLIGEKKCNYSPNYFYGGKKYTTKEEFDKEFPGINYEMSRLMIGSKPGTHVIKNRFGQLMHCSDSIVILPEKS